MSRMIPGRKENTEEERLLQSEDGKLLIMEYSGKNMMFLIKNNRLLLAAAVTDSADMVGAVYLGRVKKVVRNINACFVETEKGKPVFLSLTEAEYAYPVNRRPDGRILEGDLLPVQILREALKTKQAAATTKLSLAGKYVVFQIGSRKAFVSGKLEDADKKRLLKLLKDHGLIDPAGNVTGEGYADPANGSVSAERCVGSANGDGAEEWAPSYTGLPPYGVILRTQAAEAGEDELLAEFAQMRETFRQLFLASKYKAAPVRLDHAVSPWENALSQAAGGYTEAVTDSEALYHSLQGYFQERKIPLRLYADPSYSLCRLYSIETKLKEATARRVWLRSGAYLVIDETEAMTVIDVNSGKYDAHKASEDAVYLINLEAAAEIALQIRLRNLSGIILVDFISMTSARYQGDLLRETRRLLKEDKVPTKAVDITALGLMEITRKKVSRTLAEQLKPQKGRKDAGGTGKAAKEMR